jgi:hypothetical protein
VLHRLQTLEYPSPPIRPTCIATQNGTINYCINSQSANRPQATACEPAYFERHLAPASLTELQALSVALWL